MIFFNNLEIPCATNICKLSKPSYLNVFILLFFVTCFFQMRAMKIYEVCTELFSKFEGVEYYSYIELKKNPLPIKVNYLAVPWHDATIKGNIKKIKEALKGIQLKGGFTILYPYEENSHDKIMELVKSTGIDCIFTPRATTNCSVVNGMKIIPYPYHPLNGVGPDRKKDILYSFVGIFSSHPVRKQLSVLDNPPEVIIKDSKNWISHQHVNEFKDLLARSRFSLCPRGYAANSIRFYESLQAGAIPILISDTALLPDGFDWASCCIRVAEKDVANIPIIIKQITPEKEHEMRQACYLAHRLFSGKNLISPIRCHYGIMPLYKNINNESEYFDKELKLNQENDISFRTIISEETMLSELLELD